MKNIIIFALVIIIAGGAGFGFQRYLQQDSRDLAPIIPKAVNNNVIGTTRPAFKLKDLEGQLRNIDEWNGKVLLINFWATWCPPCRRELPAMNRAWKKLKDEGIVMLAVDVGEDEDTIFTFMADYPIDFTVLLDSSGEISASWPVVGLPTTFVLDKEGRLVYRAIGGREWDDEHLLEKVRALK